MAGYKCLNIIELLKCEQLLLKDLKRCGGNNLVVQKQLDECQLHIEKFKKNRKLENNHCIYK